MWKRKMFVTTICSLILVFWYLPASAELIVDTSWVRTYNGPGDTADYVRGLAIDSSGNVYVTGTSVGSGTDWDYATIKYHPDGETAWVRRYNGPGDFADRASAIAVDDSGNVYVTGYSDDDVTNYDYVTIKYGPDGDTGWIRTYNGSGDYADVAHDVAVDNSGYVYVTGHSGGGETSYDFATIKYYPNGYTDWIERYNGPGNEWDFAHAIALDGSGNVYVTGRSEGSGTLYDYATIKYYPDGDTAWVRRYNGPADSVDYPNAIAADASGNVYVTGYSFGSGTASDYDTIKYDQNGNELWVERYNGPEDSIDVASALALDGSGNIYVTGSSYGSGTSHDCVTIEYYPDGDTAWVRRYNGPADTVDVATALAVDVWSNVYVTGYCWSTDAERDYVTLMYYPNGDIAWVKTFNGTADTMDLASDVTVDNRGNVYVTGYSYGIGTNLDYVTVKYFQALRGDVNRDGIIDVGDVVYLVSYLYRGGYPPDPLVVGDCNCDDIINVGDIVYLVSYLYRGGDPPDC